MLTSTQQGSRGCCLISLCGLLALAGISNCISITMGQGGLQDSRDTSRKRLHLSLKQTLLHQELLLAAPRQLPLVEFWSLKEEFRLSLGIQCINTHRHGASSCSSSAMSANSAALPTPASSCWVTSGGDQVKPPCSWEVTGNIQAISSGSAHPEEAQRAEAHPKADNGNPPSQLVLLPGAGGSFGTPQVPAQGSQPQGSPGGDELQCSVGRRFPAANGAAAVPAFHRKRGWEQRPGEERQLGR